MIYDRTVAALAACPPHTPPTAPAMRRPCPTCAAPRGAGCTHTTTHAPLTGGVHPTRIKET